MYRGGGEKGGMSREKIMPQWDYWRQRIAGGDVSSSPRDWFESVLEVQDETLSRIKKRLEAEKYGGIYVSVNIDFAIRIVKEEGEG